MIYEQTLGSLVYISATEVEIFGSEYEKNSFCK